MTQDVRKTKKYTLYRGHHQTANLYSVIRQPDYADSTMGYSETWLNEMQKEELVKLPDDDFDRECSKIKFK